MSSYKKAELEGLLLSARKTDEIRISLIVKEIREYSKNLKYVEGLLYALIIIDKDTYEFMRNEINNKNDN